MPADTNETNKELVPVSELRDVAPIDNKAAVTLTKGYSCRASHTHQHPKSNPKGK